jgi:iron-sulfur cluster assembly accessory protein
MTGVTIEEFDPEKDAAQGGPGPGSAVSEPAIAKASDRSGEPVSPGDFPVQLTEKAVEMVKAALVDLEDEDGDMLRVGVRGGGCSGFSYSLNFVEDTDDDDTFTQMDGVVVVIDPFSAAYLKGTIVDYVDSVSGSGFKFTNPNAKRTCGCGSSFSA